MRWYVKVSRKGRRIGISEEYGTPAFDAAYEAAVAALGGVMRMRRVKGTVKPGPAGTPLFVRRRQPARPRALLCATTQQAAESPHQGRATPEFEAEVDKAVSEQIGLYG
jgi:hypothetical protein